MQFEYVIKEIPPSNNEFMGNGRKASNYRYQNIKRIWEWNVRAAVGKNKPKAPLEKSIVTLKYYFGSKHRRDPDNYSGKFLLDGLVKSKVIEDDSFSNIMLVIEGYYDKENERTEIVVEKIE